MIEHQGVFLPDGEVHFVEWMNNAGELVDGRGTYQITKFREAMKYTVDFHVAVDIGAHVGLWSMQLAKKFSRVHAFEPVAKNRECYRLNLKGTDFRLHECALGDREATVNVTTDPTCSAASMVDGFGEVPMRRLDSFNLNDVDFIKIDTEGYELFVVRGAEETIKFWRPTIIVEQKGHGMERHGFRKEEAAELIESWGYKRAANMTGDIILVPA